MIEINQLDLFSGIGGFHLGFERAGFKVNSFFSEIDKHAIAVYKQQFKDSKYVGSVTNVRGADLPRIDLITFGSPCQDFSVAGTRKGMDGERSGLIVEAIRLVNECRPRVFVWENVKGTFSSNDGRDFAAIIKEFANIGGYRFEWQLLNTSWFLPQNRERIYLVGYSTTPERGWRGIFPIGTGIGNDTVQSIKVVGDRGTGGQQGLIFDDSGISPCVNACTYKDPIKIKANYNYEALNKSIENNRHLLKEGEPKAIDCYNQSIRDESPCLTSPEHNTTRLFDGSRIRKLTPIECERLQGFPDNHTAFGDYDGEVKPVSNTQRYKQCGNAVTVDVVKAVAEKIKPIFNA